ncbi:hypothetical protein K7432_013865 [Basidiobolus ranarum]|uniref:Uncharacterized protein n=1 Tax=Basidiobolus ranarum TaxID=34480 RepID=A0ABR2WIH6_9FUNG
MTSAKTTSDSPQKNPFTPENYPGLIFQRNGLNAICYHGDTIYLAKTVATCPRNTCCYGLDTESAKILEVLKVLEKKGNKIWPVKFNRQGLPRRFDPKFSKKNWPGKGETAKCKGNWVT